MKIFFLFTIVDDDQARVLIPNIVKEVISLNSIEYLYKEQTH